MGTEFFIVISVFPVELFSLPSFNVLHCKLAKIALSIYSI